MDRGTQEILAVCHATDVACTYAKTWAEYLAMVEEELVAATSQLISPV